jgi:hypothetical protein
VVVVLGALAAAGCADSATPEALRAEVDSVVLPSGWDADGPPRSACPTLNLDCQDATAGVTLTRQGSLEGACGSVALWATSTPQLVDPDASSGLGEPAPPDAGSCVDEIERRGRWLVVADAPDGGGVPDGATWSVLLQRQTGGWRLDVVLGDPPTVFAPPPTGSS